MRNLNFGEAPIFGSAGGPSTSSGTAERTELTEGAEIAGTAAVVEPVETQGPQSEPVKGVQTYLPLSQYMQLSVIKTQQRTTIARLAAEAIGFWLQHRRNDHPK